MSNKKLKAVAQAIQAGDKEKARRLLRPILMHEPSADAWVLAAYASESREQAILCLQNALTLDPLHERAASALSGLGYPTFSWIPPTPSQGQVTGVPLQRASASRIATKKKLPKGWRIFRVTALSLIGLMLLMALVLDLVTEDETIWSRNSYPTVDAWAISSQDMPRIFCQTLQNRLSRYALVRECDSSINQDGRLEAYTEIQLTQTQNYQTSLDVMEVALRTYEEISRSRPGYIQVLTEWRRGRFTCHDNVGMGFRTLARLADWEHASQSEIFAIVDRQKYPQIYADGSDNAHYGDMGWSPDPSGVPDCNQ